MLVLTATPIAGDVGLTRGPGFNDWCIRYAEQRKYGRGSPESEFNHVFAVVDDAGGIIEAQGRGVVRDSLAKYDAVSHAVYRPPYLTPADRDRAIEIMEAALGAEYGYTTIVCEGLAFLTGTRLRFGLINQHICSGIVSHALALAGLTMGDDEEWNSPADVMHAVLVGSWALIERRPAAAAA